jgi:serine/threonine-protein kinase RsbW
VDQTQEIVVSLPARPELMHVLRTVTAAVAARADFAVDAIEDLKIAVDETASQLLRGAPATSLTFRLVVSEGSLEVIGETDAPPRGPWPPEGFERSLPWQVLTALTDETAYWEDGGAIVRFAKRRG